MSIDVPGGGPVRHIVAAPTPAAVRLRPGETLEEWWVRTRPNSDVRVDIIGGGYTSMFFDPPSTRPFD